MKILVPAFLAFTIFFLSSCQQEPDVILEDPTPPASDVDTTMLLQYIVLDANNQSDTIDKMVFTYDAQKRITSYFLAAGAFGNENTDYFYTGNNTLPYKYIWTWSDAIADYVDTGYVSYANGIVSRDSVIEYKVTTNEFWGTDVVYFIPEGNNMKIIKRDYFSPGLTPPDDERKGTLIQTRVNGNIVAQDDTAANPEVYFNRPHQTASYDNKPCPFVRIETPFPVLGYWSGIARNNPTAQKEWDVDPTSVTELHYSYTYRADGYPLTVMLSEPGQPPYGKGIFIYAH